MMVELIVTCGATVDDIAQEYRSWTGERLLFEKLWTRDSRGEYGEYLIWLTAAQAQVVANRYSTVIREAVGTVSINES